MVLDIPSVDEILCHVWERNDASKVDVVCVYYSDFGGNKQPRNINHPNNTIGA